MQEEKFKLTVQSWTTRKGLVLIEGRWNGGRCPAEESTVTHARTGQPLFVNEVAIGEGPVSLVLGCGHAQPVVQELKAGDVLNGH